MFPSRFLKCADLNGKSRIVEIVEVGKEVLKDMQGKSQLKQIVFFKYMKKALPLNKTNFQALVRITGEDDSELWISHKVLMKPSVTEMAGEQRDCIRFEAVPKPKAVKAEEVSAPNSEDPGADMDDDFAN